MPNALGLQARLFRPVLGDEVTTTLFVGNVGPAVGISADAIEQQCSAFGPVAVDIPDDTKSFAFCTFESTSDSQRAKCALEVTQPWGREITVKFARLSPKYRDASEAASKPVYVSSEEIGIPGLQLYCDFVTADEEADLLAAVSDAQWQTLAKRRVCHFGFEFDYLADSWRRLQRRTVARGRLGPIPDFCAPLLPRMQALPDVPEIDQLTVNQYPAGIGLAPHVDAHSAFSGAVLSLSLGSSAVMEFRLGSDHRPLLLPRRSLLVMAHESRYLWEHYIPHRKRDIVGGEVLKREPLRTSFTFRKARGFPCDCSFPTACDSQESPVPPTRKMQILLAAQTEATGMPAQQNGHVAAPSKQTCQEAAQTSDRAIRSRGGGGGEAAVVHGSHQAVRVDDPCAADGTELMHACMPDLQQGEDVDLADEAQLQELEEQHVHQVYNAIAPHFSATRVAIWPEVKRFIDSLPSGAVVADVGCGNGKYFDVRPDLAVLGSDRSPGLVRLAMRRVVNLQALAPVPRADALVADGMALPFRRASCDAVLCIAVLHHISSPQRRVRFLARLAALLVPGGRAIVSVWATQQEKPAKTVARWSPVHVPSSAVAPPGSDAAPKDDLQVPCQQCAGQGSGNQTVDDASGRTANYFVPWHVPFHRAGEHLASLRRGSGADDGAPPGGATSVPDTDGKVFGEGSALGEVDESKKTVVFRRYYHLFAETELEALVAQVQGVRLCSCVYDASNWVAVFERMPS